MVAAGLVLAGCSSSAGRSAAPPSGSTPSNPVATAGRAGCPGGSAPGVTPQQVSVAATIIDISGGSLSNATFGVPSAADQKADWMLVADSINKSGGVGCRQLSMQFYDINPVDANTAQETCLNIAAAHPFMVLDSGTLTETGASACLPAHKVPMASTYLTEEQLNQYHPYYLQIGDLPENILRNGVLGLNQLGYFSPAKGFKKVGVLYHTCSSSLVAAQQQALREAGVTADQTVDYSLGCPTGLDTPASFEQAVLDFKNAGVSDVLMVEITDGGVFTQIAAQQKFQPQYLFAENDIAVNGSTGANAPNPTNYDGAVDVLGGAYGEQSTPGYQPSGGTEKCNSIYAAAGQPSVYSQTTGYPGLVCDYLWFVQSLLNHAPTFQAASFPQAMRAMGTAQFSYPFAPTNFSAAPTDATYGISYWRAAVYHATCKCWQIPDPTFHPPFP
jgi:hypothetical protein